MAPQPAPDVLKAAIDARLIDVNAEMSTYIPTSNISQINQLRDTESYTPLPRDFTHHRINHSKLFADRQNHINGIENFWNQAKRVLRKYNGIDRKSFPLFLKECEFRFNFGTPSEQLKVLRRWCGI